MLRENGNSRALKRNRKRKITILLSRAYRKLQHPERTRNNQDTT
jgi:hypothetical protein